MGQKQQKKKHKPRSPIKHTRESTAGVKSDHISKLPNDILCHVISFLPFVSAVETSILSTRWRQLWDIASITLNYDEGLIKCNGTTEEMTGAVIDFIECYDPMESYSPPRLQYHFDQNKVLLATIKAAELSLYFSRNQGSTSNNFEWRLDFGCHYYSRRISNCIKTLHLRSVSSLSVDTVSALFSNLDILETLKMSECTGLECLRIGSFRKLKKLIVMDCPQLNDVQITTTVLKSFHYRGALPRFQIEYGYGGQLIDVVLHVRDGPGYDPLCIMNIDSLKKALKGVEALTVSGWLLQVMVSRYEFPSYYNPRGSFHFNSLKKLWWIDTSMDRYKINSLTSFIKICPNLENLFINISPTSYCFPSESSICCFWEKYIDHVAYFMRLEYLKIVRLVGFPSQMDEILLVSELLKKALAVRPIFISTKSNGEISWQMVKIPARQLKRCQLRHNGKGTAMRNLQIKYGYKFIEGDGEDKQGMYNVLRPKHGHIC